MIEEQRDATWRVHEDVFNHTWTISLYAKDFIMRFVTKDKPSIQLAEEPAKKDVSVELHIPNDMTS